MSVTPQPLAGQLTRDVGVIGRRRGRVGVREYIVLSCDGVCSAGVMLITPEPGIK